MNATLDTYDVFLSYSSAQGDVARLVRDALAGRGVSVWWDREGIRHFDLISAELEAGIERSRLTVALGSRQHLSSRVCQWETLYSLCVGDRAGTDRLRIISLDDSLSDYSDGAKVRHAVPYDGTPGSLASAVEAVVTHLATLPEPGPKAPGSRGSLFGVPGDAGERMVGRTKELLRVHDALGSAMRKQDHGSVNAQHVCVVHGMGGVGKSYLAMFYAREFGPSYPSGVLWLRAGGDGVDNVARDRGGRATVLRSLEQDALEWLVLDRGVDLGGLNLPARSEERWAAVRNAVATEVGEQDLLVVVDDVPAGIRLEDVLPRSPHVVALVTSRVSSGAQAGYPSVPLHELDPEDAVLLLTNALDPDLRQRRRGEDPWQGGVDIGRRLVAEVGYHPLAVDLLALRLASREPAGRLLSEVQELRSDFMDVPGILVDLPTGHKPSILATIASSVRAAAGTEIFGALQVMRVLAVLPPGETAPVDLLDAVVGGSSGAARSLLEGWSLLSHRADGATCHALTRAVVRLVFESGAPPFDGHPDIEPHVSFAVAEWLYQRADQIRSEPVESARLSRACLDVLAPMADSWTQTQRFQRSESCLACAREVFRDPAARPMSDYDLAFSWVTEAQAAVDPPSEDWEVMCWLNAEAMRGLLLSHCHEPAVQPALTKADRDRMAVEALQVCKQADLKRREVAERLLAEPDPFPSRQWVVKKLEDSMFNVPGRLLGVAKRLAAAEEPDRSAIRDKLEEMDSTHQKLIEVRSAHGRVNWSAVASSHEGRGSAAYHLAVLVGTSLAERRQLLAAALPHLFESLRIRRNLVDVANENDVTKSLRLLVKTSLGAVALDEGRDSMLARLSEWRAECDAIVCAFPTRPYQAGPVRATAPATGAQGRRDQCSRTLDALRTTLAENPAATDDLREVARTALSWLAVAKHCGMSSLTVDEVLEPFLRGTADLPAELELLVGREGK